LSASKRLLSQVAQPEFLIRISLAMARFYGESCSLFVQSPVKKGPAPPPESLVSKNAWRASEGLQNGKKSGMRKGGFQGKSAVFAPVLERRPVDNS
jgi:hypothetical protein